LRLFDSIGSYFGKSQVFIDVDSIEAGTDFNVVIRDRLAQCDVFLALIGRNWVRCTNQRGDRRLDDPADFVRIEVGQALGRAMRFIPVLVGGAQMPRPEDLPADIQPLVLHNAHEIPDRFFDQSVQQLISALKSSVRREGWTDASTRRNMIVAGATGAVALAGGGLFTAITLSKTTTKTGTPSTAAGVREPEMPRIDIPDNMKPGLPIIVKHPVKISQLPPAVKGPWIIDKLSFTKYVSGPVRLPHLLWAAPSMPYPDAWTPDEMSYSSNGYGGFAGFRQGKEEWAYKLELGEWTFWGVTNDGRAWLTEGSASWQPRSSGVYCFNSHGEGGYFAGRQDISRNVIRAQKEMQPIKNVHYPSFLDGNRKWERQDDFGRLYVCTDRGTVYCFSTKGTVFWQFAAGTPIPREPLFSHGDLIFPTSDRLFCLRDGAFRWALPLRDCTSLLVDKDGTIFLSYIDKFKNYDYVPPQLMDRKLMAAVDRDGHVLWRVYVHGFEVSFLDPAGRLYVTSEGSVLCLNA
jgi:outer membrane protein assembly factor BamB